ncbi:MAG TPA: hypothetical protein VNB29_02405, partial [Chthoniobacterales bacterium]|jgi:hypothetical protein|nr:hypothetical protein [Chthoniobacterales bacterium]
MKIPMVLCLAAGAIALCSCANEDGFPKSTPESRPNGDTVVHTPVVGLTTVTKKTEADNPY